jgi:hypothetical protein
MPPYYNQQQASLTPEQIQQISQLPIEQQVQIYEQLAAERGQPTSYNDFLASRGQQPQQQQDPGAGADMGLPALAGSGYLAKQLGLGEAASAAPTGLVTEGLGTGIPGLQGGTALINGQVGIPGLQGGQALVGGQIPEAAVSGWDLANIGAGGNYILPAAGAVGAYDLLSNDYGPGRGALQGAASGAAIGSYAGAPGALIGGAIGGAIGLGKGLMRHESTADVQKKHTAGLASQSDDPAWQAYLRGMRNQTTPDPSKPFAGGQYSTWDEYKNAGLDSADLTGVYGNLKTFGPDWAKLNFDQQRAVTQGIIDAGLYNSKKGEVEITDEARARDIFKNISQGGNSSSAKDSKKTSSNSSSASSESSSNPSKIWTATKSGSWENPTGQAFGDYMYRFPASSAAKSTPVLTYNPSTSSVSSQNMTGIKIPRIGGSMSSGIMGTPRIKY